MSYLQAITLAAVLLVAAVCDSTAKSPGALTLSNALQRAVAANPRLTVADREVGAAVGRKIQAGAIPNPEASFELDNSFGTGEYRGLRSAESTLQLSQLIELGGKRQARIAVGSAELEATQWQRAALRLEILSETTIAFVNVLNAQRRIQTYDAQISSLEKLAPLLQRRVEAGASSPAEVARSQVAADLVRVERERARTALAIARRELAILMGQSAPDFTEVVGELSRFGRPPTFAVIVRALDDNPQLIRWTAVRAQRDAQLLSARLKPIPDVRLGVGWRHFRETNDDAVRLGASIPLPVWDQNQGSILEAEEQRAKTDAERDSTKASLILALGRAYETLLGAVRETELLRTTVLPRIRQAAETIESGYGQGRFTLLELLDIQNTATQAALREHDALVNFHVAVATIEGLTGVPLNLTRVRTR